VTDTTITCTVSPCTVVIQLDIPVLNMSPEDGTIIGFAIVAVWAVGLAFRMVSRVLNDGDQTSEREL
jgi:hypothetical protein